MRILMISRHSPLNPKSGAQQRTDIIYRAVDACAEVWLAVVSDEEQDWAALRRHYRVVDTARLEQFGIAHPYPRLHRHCRSLARALNFLSPGYGFHVHGLLRDWVFSCVRRTACDGIVVRDLQIYAQSGLQDTPRVVVDVDDLPEESYQTQVVDSKRSRLKRAVFQWRQRAVRAHTRNLIQRCAHVWLANPEQVRFPNATCLPNLPYSFLIPGRRPRAGATHPTAEPTVLFVGSMSYGPNQQAMSFFVDSVWREIAAAVPAARVRIVGRGLPADLRTAWEKVPGVDVVGEVEDIDTEYRRAAVAVAPMFSGGGTNIKVIEALSMAVACVASPFAVKGFGAFLRDGENIAIAADRQAFAEKTITLLRSAAARAALGSAGRRAVEATFSFEQVKGIVAADLAASISPGAHDAPRGANLLAGP